MNTPFSDFTFRLAQAADLPEIVAIYNSTVSSRQATADLSPVSVNSRMMWFDAHRRAHRPLYVLCDAARQVAAWSALSDYYPREAYRISAEISVYVHQDFRRQGLGQYVLVKMMEKAAKIGIRNLIAVIFAHNAASIALFAQAGFTLWGTLPQVCDMEDFEADVVILGKRIGENRA